MYQYAILSKKGAARLHNEDAIQVQKGSYINYKGTNEWLLAIISDGMGGHNAGEVASSTVSRYAPSLLQLHAMDIEKGSIYELLERGINLANAKILELANKRAEYTGMGATVTMGFIVDDVMHIAHVGDSRIYYLSSTGFKEITVDQTKAHELVESGEILVSDERKHPAHVLLTNYIGNDKLEKITHYNIKLEDSSKILFCTDGLHDVLTNDEIEAILKKDDLPEVLCKVLISSVIEKEGDDDVSVVVIINQK